MFILLSVYNSETLKNDFTLFLLLFVWLINNQYIIINVFNSKFVLILS